MTSDYLQDVYERYRKIEPREDECENEERTIELDELQVFKRNQKEVEFDKAKSRNQSKIGRRKKYDGRMKNQLKTMGRTQENTDAGTDMECEEMNKRISDYIQEVYKRYRRSEYEQDGDGLDEGRNEVQRNLKGHPKNTFDKTRKNKTAKERSNLKRKVEKKMMERPKKRYQIRTSGESSELGQTQSKRLNINMATRAFKKRLKATGASKEEVKVQITEFVGEKITKALPSPMKRKRKRVRKSGRTDPSYDSCKAGKSDALVSRRAIKCSVCGSCFVIREALILYNRHVENCVTMDTSKKDLQCSLCKKWSCSSDYLRDFLEHLKSGALTTTLAQALRYHGVILSSSAKCNLCQDSCFLPFPEFARHIYRYHQHEFGCTQCTFRGRASGNMGEHWKYVHRNLKDTPVRERYHCLPPGSKVPLPDIPWWCPAPQCLQKFSDEASRDTHFPKCQHSDHLPERNKNCVFCERHYFSEEELLMHRVIEHGHFYDDATKFLPRKLISQFSRTNMQMPRKTTATTKKKEDDCPGCCDICGKVFTRMYYIPRHIADVHGIGDFICDVGECAKAFIRIQELKDHKKYMHEGVEKPNKKYSFFCQFCGKEFNYKHRLKRHEGAMHLNRESKPFKCKLCEKTFAVQDYLRYHLRFTHKMKYSEAIAISSSN